MLQLGQPELPVFPKRLIVVTNQRIAEDSRALPEYLAWRRAQGWQVQLATESWRERSGCGTEIPIAKRVLHKQYLAFCSAYVHGGSMPKQPKDYVTVTFRRWCSFKDPLRGEIAFYGFDAEKEKDGIQWIIDEVIGSGRAFKKELSQHDLSPNDVIMFGVGGDFEEDDTDVTGMPLLDVVEQMAQVWGMLFYDPSSGECYIIEEGTWDSLGRKVSKLRFRH